MRHLMEINHEIWTNMSGWPPTAVTSDERVRELMISFQTE